MVFHATTYLMGVELSRCSSSLEDQMQLGVITVDSRISSRVTGNVSAGLKPRPAGRVSFTRREFSILPTRLRPSEWNCR